VKSAARVLAVFVVVALVLFVMSRFLLPRLFVTTTGSADLAASLVGRPLPPLTGLAWLNGEPLPPDSLRGRPAVVAVWSDTDPECLRELPAIQAWHQAYGRYGVRVVGVHEPDFVFATDSTVPASVVRRLGLGFPIALDPDYHLRAILGAPSGGPVVILADTSGNVVAVESGRGHLAAIESHLREQLRHMRPDLQFPGDPAAAAPSIASGGAPTSHVVHLGISRVREGPLVGSPPGQAQSFTAQFRFQVEGKSYVPYPVGLWTPTAEGAVANRGGAENFVALRYDAGALWAVLSPPRGETVRVWMLRDEKWPAAADLGADGRLDGRGAAYVEVSEPRLYEVFRAGAGEHVAKLSPESPGVTFHALIVEPPATPN
jgi:thiol-disulfide isomerase/thioredoxin